MLMARKLSLLHHHSHHTHHTHHALDNLGTGALGKRRTGEGRLDGRLRGRTAKGRFDRWSLRRGSGRGCRGWSGRRRGGGCARGFAALDHHALAHTLAAAAAHHAHHHAFQLARIMTLTKAVGLEDDATGLDLVLLLSRNKVVLAQGGDGGHASQENGKKKLHVGAILGQTICERSPSLLDSVFWR